MNSDLKHEALSWKQLAELVGKLKFTGVKLHQVPVSDFSFRVTVNLERSKLMS